MDFLYAPIPHSLAFYIRDASLLKLSKPLLIPQGWTLTVEFVLSVLVPLGVLIALRRTIWLVVATVLLIWSMKGPPFILHFALGILIAKHLPAIRNILFSKTHIALVLIAAIALATSPTTVFFRIGEGDWDTWWIWCLGGIGSAGILAAVMCSKALQSSLSIPALRYIGKISYGTYLIHMQVLACLTPLFLVSLHAQSRQPAWLEGLAFTLVATLLLASMFHPLVEAPSIALGKKWARQINGESMSL